MAALELGCFDYAHGVLDNYLTYFVRPGGRVLYRGLEMPQLARLLTVPQSLTTLGLQPLTPPPTGFRSQPSTGLTLGTTLF